MSEDEFQQVLENIRKFQAPPLDINKFTVEKQGKSGNREMLEEGEMEELIEDAMLETNDDYEIYEGEIEEEEQ